MKFTLFGALTLAFALGTTTTSAAPFAGSESNDVQLRSEKAVTQMLSRSFEDYNGVERSFDDDLLEYTSRSIGDSGSAEDLLVRGYSTESELYERSPDDEDLVILARSLGPVEFSHFARSDEDDALFARDEELLYGRAVEETTPVIASRSVKSFFKKLGHKIKGAFKKVGQGLLKVGKMVAGAVLRR